MSLRMRLTLLVTALFIVVVSGAGVYVIDNARRTVADETEATARLTLQILEASLADPAVPGGMDAPRHLLQRLAQLESTRHLEIVVNRSGTPDSRMPPRLHAGPVTAAPHWFVDLVRPPPREIRRLVGGPDQPFTEIIIRADPSDEIDEAWRETRGVLVALAVFFLLANLLIYVSLGRDLAPIETILRGLERIERGDYELRLPGFAATELNRISAKFNHMAGVLQESRRENRRLARRMQDIQEEERRFLAREMHDELGQSLTAVRTMVASIADHAEQVPDDVRVRLREVAAIAGRTFQSARRIMKRLRPGVLDELGVRPALEELVDAWNGRYGESFCGLEFRGVVPEGDSERALCIYRTVQEALTNVARHAGPCSVRVVLEVVDDGIGLEIADDGHGFDPAYTPAGLGLSGMRERVQFLNGVFRMDSAPGRGTTISVHLQVPTRETAAQGEAS